MADPLSHLPDGKKNLLVPPDPSEPEGCSGNPQQNGSYIFPLEYKLIDKDTSVQKLIHLEIGIYATYEGDESHESPHFFVG